MPSKQTNKKQSTYVPKLKMISLNKSISGICIDGVVHKPQTICYWGHFPLGLQHWVIREASIGLIG